MHATRHASAHVADTSSWARARPTSQYHTLSPSLLGKRRCRLHTTFFFLGNFILIHGSNYPITVYPGASTTSLLSAVAARCRVRPSHSLTKQQLSTAPNPAATPPSSL